MLSVSQVSVKISYIEFGISRLKLGSLLLDIIYIIILSIFEQLQFQ